MAKLLEDAVVVMRERLDRMRGITRLHTPSVAEPLIVLIVDEIAALTAWINDRTMKRRIESALGLLLSQGCSPGTSTPNPARRTPPDTPGRPGTRRCELVSQLRTRSRPGSLPPIRLAVGSGDSDARLCASMRVVVATLSTPVMIRTLAS